MLAGADWLTAPHIQKVMSLLDKEAADSARFVGGCVRNTLMGRAVDDIDVATRLKPERVLDVLRGAGLRVIPTGIEHGTVTAVIDSHPIEITTLRRDVETDGRRAVIAFTEDWAEDAKRRDFRLNAIYADIRGKLYDPTGGGIEDAAQGRVVFIGDADMRLREDYLRILRFFRFNAWYGAGIDPDGLAACARQKVGLKQIAAERIWKELKKLLTAPDPAAAVMAMIETGILEVLLPEARSPEKITQYSLVEQRFSLNPDPMGRLLAMLSPAKDQDSLVAHRLKLSTAERDRITAWLKATEQVRAPQCSLQQSFYEYGAQAMCDYALVQYGGHEDWNKLSEVLDFAETWQRPVFPIKGADLLAAGLPPGPKVGETLRRLEAYWTAHDFTPDRAALLAQLSDPSA